MVRLPLPPMCLRRASRPRCTLNRSSSHRSTKRLAAFVEYQTIRECFASFTTRPQISVCFCIGPFCTFFCGRWSFRINIFGVGVFSHHFSTTLTNPCPTAKRVLHSFQVSSVQKRECCPNGVRHTCTEQIFQDGCHGKGISCRL